MSGTEKMLLLIAGLVLILVGMGLTGFWSRASMSRKSKPDLTQFSKWVVADVRPLLWVVTIGGFALAFYCVYKGFTGALPWIGAMVGLPWTRPRVICAAIPQPVQIRPPARRNHLRRGQGRKFQCTSADEGAGAGRLC